MRLLWILAGLALAVIIDSAVMELTGGRRVFDPFLIVTVATALRGRKAESMIVGATAGLVQDLLGSVVFGIHFLGKLVVSYFAALMAGRLIPGQPLSAIVLLAGGTVIEVFALAGAGFLLGQSFQLRTPGELGLSVLLNTAVGMTWFALAKRFDGDSRRRPAHARSR